MSAMKRRLVVKGGKIYLASPQLAPPPKEETEYTLDGVPLEHRESTDEKEKD